MRAIITLLIVTALAGCATDPNYTNYLRATQAQAASHKSEIQLLRIKAKTGQTITLGGVEELVVAMPAAPAPGVEQKRPSEWAGVMNNAIGVLGTVGIIYESGKAAVGLANAVGNASQSPQPNVSNSYNTGNSGADSGDNRGNPVSGNSGSESGDNRDNPVTTTTDDHAVDDHSVDNSAGP